MANKVENVSFGKPKIGGAMYCGPIGSKLPTNATEELNEAFKSLGYISEDGLENDDKIDTDPIRAWGGDIVLVVNKGKTDEFKYTLIECMNVEVLKQIYGEKNVSGDKESGITIKSTSTPLESHAIVIDMILQGGVLKRIVIPNGAVSEVGTITYKDEEPIGYETTLTCIPDESGVHHYEYIQKADI